MENIEEKWDKYKSLRDRYLNKDGSFNPKTYNDLGFKKELTEFYTSLLGNYKSCNCGNPNTRMLNKLRKHIVTTAKKQNIKLN